MEFDKTKWKCEQVKIGQSVLHKGVKKECDKIHATLNEKA